MNKYIIAGDKVNESSPDFKVWEGRISTGVIAETRAEAFELARAKYDRYEAEYPGIKVISLGDTTHNLTKEEIDNHFKED